MCLILLAVSAAFQLPYHFDKCEYMELQKSRHDNELLHANLMNNDIAEANRFMPLTEPLHPQEKATVYNTQYTHST